MQEDTPMELGRPDRPWDLFEEGARVSRYVEESRLNICSSCEYFVKSSTLCRQCGCIMEAKTKLRSAKCPIDKWEKV